MRQDFPSITRNETDLPRTVTFSDGSSVAYSYAADGAKLRETRTVLETDDYYPLGGPLPTGTSTSLQPQKFQGKDWNPSASFNVYDFGARLYDPALGRWLSQDPLAEKYQAHSPYLFCAGITLYIRKQATTAQSGLRPVRENR